MSRVQFIKDMYGLPRMVSSKKMGRKKYVLGFHLKNATVDGSNPAPPGM